MKSKSQTTLLCALALALALAQAPATLRADEGTAKLSIQEKAMMAQAESFDSPGSEVRVEAIKRIRQEALDSKKGQIKILAISLLGKAMSGGLKAPTLAAINAVTEIAGGSGSGFFKSSNKSDSEAVEAKGLEVLLSPSASAEQEIATQAIKGIGSISHSSLFDKNRETAVAILTPLLTSKTPGDPAPRLVSSAIQTLEELQRIADRPAHTEAEKTFVMSAMDAAAVGLARPEIAIQKQAVITIGEMAKKANSIKVMDHLLIALDPVIQLKNPQVLLEGIKQVYGVVSGVESQELSKNLERAAMTKLAYYAAIDLANVSEAATVSIGKLAARSYNAETQSLQIEVLKGLKQSAKPGTAKAADQAIKDIFDSKTAKNQMVSQASKSLQAGTVETSMSVTCPTCELPRDSKRNDGADSSAVAVDSNAVSFTGQGI